MQQTHELLTSSSRAGTQFAIARPMAHTYVESLYLLSAYYGTLVTYEKRHRDGDELRRWWPGQIVLVVCVRQYGVIRT